ncbi:MAG TPA: Gfo/Idh/MocA family oxidoreductase [Phycisphaerae bacterium]|nr:Gfo/Idh/MocA family oxidoreductase [Phycisphaerae bacterium]
MAKRRRKIRFGVIGAAGVIGRTHVQAVLANKSRAELVAVNDIDVPKLEGMAAELGVRAYHDYRKLCADPDIDAVMIGTPHPLHPAQALAAIKHGKHVLTEKAIAGRLSQGHKMVEAARKARLKIGVCFQHRQAPWVVQAKRMIDRGMLGPLYRIVCEGSAFKAQRYYASAAWRGTWDGEEGGVLVNQAPHPIDTMIYLSGMPSRVWAVNRSQKHRIPVEDTASALLEYPNGCQGILHWNTTQIPNTSRYEFYGDRGALIVDDDGMKFYKPQMPISRFITTFKGSNIYGKPDHVVSVPKLPKVQGGHVGLVVNFCKAITDGDKLVCSGNEGLASLELTNAMVLSSYTGTIVKLPLNERRYDQLVRKLVKTGAKAAHRPNSDPPKL